MIQIELLLAHRYWQSDKHTVRFSVAVKINIRHRAATLHRLLTMKHLRTSLEQDCAGHDLQTRRGRRKKLASLTPSVTQFRRWLARFARQRLELAV